MTDTQRDNLRMLAAFLRELPPGRLKMKDWVGKDWEGKPDLSCGTTACAIGWASTIPHFRKQGLRLIRSYDVWQSDFISYPEIVSEPDLSYPPRGREAVEFLFGENAWSIFAPENADNRDKVADSLLALADDCLGPGDLLSLEEMPF